MVNYKLLIFKEVFIPKQSMFYFEETFKRKRSHTYRNRVEWVVAKARRVGKMWRCWPKGTSSQF